jgi:glycosyltransferase involved in cell wall biosynthesis
MDPFHDEGGLSLDRQLVSIIIPTFNRADLLKRAVDSAQKQVIPGDEIIVVDDGSTDNTEQILSSYREKIKYFKIANSGAGAARNFGLRNSLNPLVAFLDSDDEWMPYKLDLQRAFMQARPDVLFCFTDFAVTFKGGGEARNYLRNWLKDPRPWDKILGPGEQFSNICQVPEGMEDFKFYVGDLYPSMLRNSYVNTDTIVVRRDMAGQTLHFAEDLPWGEDWVCYSQLSGRGPAAYLDCETAWQHGHGGIRLTDTGPLDGVSTRIAIMKRVWGSDDKFLKIHGSEYERLLRSQSLLKVKELIAIGHAEEAREELRSVVSPPAMYRILASMPGTLMRILLAARRSLLLILGRK